MHHSKRIVYSGVFVVLFTDFAILGAVISVLQPRGVKYRINPATCNVPIFTWRAFIGNVIFGNNIFHSLYPENIISYMAQPGDWKDESR